MDKVMKAEIEKILEEVCYQATSRTDISWEEVKDKYFTDATSSLTALIIKWLEKHKEEIIDPTPAGRINEMLDKNIRNQLITELVEELK